VTIQDRGAIEPVEAKRIVQVLEGGELLVLNGRTKPKTGVVVAFRCDDEIVRIAVLRKEPVGGNVEYQPCSPEIEADVNRRLQEGDRDQRGFSFVVNKLFKWCCKSRVNGGSKVTLFKFVVFGREERVLGESAAFAIDANSGREAERADKFCQEATKTFRKGRNVDASAKVPSFDVGQAVFEAGNVLIDCNIGSGFGPWSCLSIGSTPFIPGSDEELFDWITDLDSLDSDLSHGADAAWNGADVSVSAVQAGSRSSHDL